MFPIPASTFWSIKVGLIGRPCRLADAGPGRPRRSPGRRARASVGRPPRPRRRRAYQAILPSRRLSQNQTVLPARPCGTSGARGRAGRGDEPKTSRHPRLNDDDTPVVAQRDDHPLPAPLHPLHDRAADPRRELLRPSPLEARTGRAPPPRASAARHRRPQAPHHRLDLRQLRHRSVPLAHGLLMRHCTWTPPRIATSRIFVKIFQNRHDSVFVLDNSDGS